MIKNVAFTRAPYFKEADARTVAGKPMLLSIQLNNRGIQDLIHALTSALNCGGSSSSAHDGNIIITNCENEFPSY